MTNKFSYILERMHRPLMLTEEKAITIFQVMSGRIDSSQITDDESLTIEASSGQIRASDYCHDVIGDIAVIKVIGSLVHRGGWIGARSGLVSYQGLTRQLDAAENDPQIKTILFEYDCPGGEVAGVFELANKIRNCGKHTVAFANNLAASAAFLLASACDERYVTDLGYVGSIGVVTIHQDISQKLEKEGVVITAIYAGADKTEGWAHKPISESFKASRQQDIDYIYEQFTAFVAVGLDVTQEHVVGTNAKSFRGQHAVDAKLADGVTTYDQLILKLTANQPQFSGATKETIMSEPKAEGAPGNEAGVTQAAHDSAVEKASNDATVTATARIGEILGCEEAKGREVQANHIAFNTEMSAEDAKGMLGASAKTVAKTHELGDGQSDFQKEMAKGENQPQIGAEGGKNSGNQNPNLADRFSARHKLSVVK
ncbi:MAG: S49 family peptidase [Rhizobiales bacterium]|nr:S49 family peptidase [Hyphomicrobiales bacterium]NRB13097.1 S49 family peptidase [Hyphomicrobiales bacterium]